MKLKKRKFNFLGVLIILLTIAILTGLIYMTKANVFIGLITIGSVLISMFYIFVKYIEMGVYY